MVQVSVPWRNTGNTKAFSLIFTSTIIVCREKKFVVDFLPLTRLDWYTCSAYYATSSSPPHVCREATFLECSHLPSCRTFLPFSIYLRTQSFSNSTFGYSLRSRFLSRPSWNVFNSPKKMSSLVFGVVVDLHMLYTQELTNCSINRTLESPVWLGEEVVRRQNNFIGNIRKILYVIWAWIV